MKLVVIAVIALASVAKLSAGFDLATYKSDVESLFLNSLKRVQDQADPSAITNLIQAAQNKYKPNGIFAPFLSILSKILQTIIDQFFKIGVILINIFSGGFTFFFKFILLCFDIVGGDGDVLCVLYFDYVHREVKDAIDDCETYVHRNLTEANQKLYNATVILLNAVEGFNIIKAVSNSINLPSYFYFHFLYFYLDHATRCHCENSFGVDS